METGRVSHAERILSLLDNKLEQDVELTLFGRAALHLGFVSPPEDFALSKDVDAVLWLGQAEELALRTNFWEATTAINDELADEGLYISHFFTEDQVILLPNWRKNRTPIRGPWRRLALYRLSNADLLLSKLMRDDPIDQADATFICSRAGFSREDVQELVARARIPTTPEIQEQFVICSKKLIASL